MLTNFFEIIVFNFGIKILGFLRDVLIASNFGVQASINNYYIVLTYISLILVFLSPGIQYSVTSLFDKTKNDEYSSYNTFILISFLGFLFIFSGIILYYFFLNSNFFSKLILILIPIPLFSIIESVFIGFLLSKRFYYIHALSSIPLNLTVIIYLLTFNVSVIGLSVATTLSYFCKLAFVYAISKKYHYKFIFEFQFNQKLTKLFKNMFNSILSGSIFYLVIYFDRIFYSVLFPGQVTYIVYSGKVIILLYTIFVVSITNVTFSFLNSDKDEKNAQFFIKSTNLSLFLIIPITIGIYFYSDFIISLLFGRGEFLIKDVLNTGSFLKNYSFAIIGIILIENFNKYLYSIGKSVKASKLVGTIISLNLSLKFIRLTSNFNISYLLLTSMSLVLGSLLYILNMKEFLKINFKTYLPFVFSGVSTYIMVYKFRTFFSVTIDINYNNILAVIKNSFLILFLYIVLYFIINIILLKLKGDDLSNLIKDTKELL